MDEVVATEIYNKLPELIGFEANLRQVTKPVKKNVLFHFFGRHRVHQPT
jgi:hypothetical protein